MPTSATRATGFVFSRNSPRVEAVSTADNGAQTNRSTPLKRHKSTGSPATLDEELIARRWLKKQGYSWVMDEEYSMHLWHHFLSVMRQPRGRADKAGSQQASFAMPIPSQMWAAAALFGARWMGNVRYTVSPSTGAIEWVPTKAITSYYIDDPAAMADFLHMHGRGLSGVAGLFKSTKTVPATGGYEASTVALTLIPPLIMEVRPGAPT
jgi:hypothetical protein